MPSDTSMKMYEAQLRSFFKKSKFSPDDDFLKNHKEVIAEIRSFYPSLHSIKNMLNAIIIYGRSIDYNEKWLAYYGVEIDKIATELKTQASTNQKTSTQTENWIDMAELDKILEDLRNDVPSKITNYKAYRILMRYLALLLQLKFPRRNDYVHMKIQSDGETIDKSVNYAVIKQHHQKSHFIFNNYKTFAKYGPQKFEIPLNIYYTLKNYKSIILEQSPDGFIFIKKDGTKMNTNEYTKFFLQFMNEKSGKNVGSTLLRHIIISDRFKVSENELKQRQDLATQMGNSVIQQMSYSKS